MRALALSIALILAGTGHAAGEDDPRFRRTTPRAPVAVVGHEIVFGVPGGRAWGLESALIRVDRSGATVALDLAVRDASVREAFVRVAWYARDEGRPRQLVTEDSAPVLPGVDRRVIVLLEPPEGAIAFRVRVLARLTAGTPVSPADALTVGRVRLDTSLRLRPSLTRLEDASRAGPR